jgi:hypothetical protein
MTCKKKFSSVWKNPTTVSWSKKSRTWWKWWKESRELDENSSFSSLSEDRFEIFSYRWKIFLACHQIHTRAAVNGDRRYYRSEVMIVKIKSAKHASQSPDPRYSYAYTWNIEYWWSDETYMHESILLLNFQANKWWFWVVDDDWMNENSWFWWLNHFNLLSHFTCFHRLGPAGPTVGSHLSEPTIS